VIVNKLRCNQQAKDNIKHFVMSRAQIIPADTNFQTFWVDGTFEWTKRDQKAVAQYVTRYLSTLPSHSAHVYIIPINTAPYYSNNYVGLHFTICI